MSRYVGSWWCLPLSQDNLYKLLLLHLTGENREKRSDPFWDKKDLTFNQLSFEQTRTLDALQETGGGEAIDLAIPLHIYASPSVADRHDENDLPKAQTADYIELSARAFAQA